MTQINARLDAAANLQESNRKRNGQGAAAAGGCSSAYSGEREHPFWSNVNT